MGRGEVGEGVRRAKRWGRVGVVRWVRLERRAGTGDGGGGWDGDGDGDGGCG